MKDIAHILLDRISSYDLVNNLLPGILYCVAVDRSLHYSILGNITWENLCICYVAGMCISRVGSCLESKLMQPCSKFHIQAFLKRAPYNKYLEAEKKDSKIPLLNTVNNTYRSLMALALCYYVTIFCYHTLGILIHNPMVIELLMAIILFALFAYSVKKQTRYIKKSVQHSLSKERLQTAHTHATNE